MNKIVVVGSLNMDLVVRIPQIPRPGETLLGGSFNTFPGGKGANQAVAAARLGGNVTMVGCVGNDNFGRELRETLERDGINVENILVDACQPTGVALIQVDDQGQNSIAVASGANFCLTERHIEKIFSSLEDFAVLVMPLETPLETVFTAARIASERGARVLLNPAPAQVLSEVVLRTVDLLIPNEHELIRMAGGTTDDFDGAAKKLLCQGVKNLLVTLGGQGSVIFYGENHQPIRIRAFPVQAVDTTAAGDCFIGALAVALCEGKSLPAAAEFASAASAIAVTRPGAQPSLPFREEVERFIIERKISL